MEQILGLPQQERATYFQEAAARSAQIKLSIIIEKDFWVCWTLQQIFSMPEISQFITFKGGTSLSKCYNIINRFSEDCDLTLDKEFLGIADNAETIAKMSSNQKKRALDSLSNAAKDKVNDVIKPLLNKRFTSALSNFPDASQWRIETDPEDEQNLLFYYPSASQPHSSGYIRPMVKLEFGARGDTVPHELRNITPYVYSILGETFNHIPSIQVQTLTAKRTFWEKATLLHAEHNRREGKSLQSRIFRHYYDLVMLDQHGITDQAIVDEDLLNTVLTNKMTYFSSGSANYEEAKIGTICLSPNTTFMSALRQDSEKMSEMFFGQQPNFEDIVTRIAAIENKINSAKE